MSWSGDYLSYLKENPEATPAEAAEALRIDPQLFAQRRRARKDVLAAEKEVKAQYFASRRALASDDTGREEIEIEDDLPLHFERFLHVYDELRARGETLRKLRQEGIDLRWADVCEAMASYPNFRRVLAELMEEDFIESEDRLTEAARNGKSWAVRMKLQAENPGKYGNRVRVDVKVSNQLGSEHRPLIDGIRDKWIGAPRVKALPAPQDDTIEGEVVQ
jgi:hypothetical protein